MRMEETKIFRTKTGHCEIRPDRIVLVRTGWRGWLAQLLFANAAPSEIVRAEITHLQAHAPVPPIKRGYFWVHYQRDGVAAKRIIICPGVFAGGQAEFERAKSLFEGEGLLQQAANNWLHQNSGRAESGELRR